MELPGLELGLSSSKTVIVNGKEIEIPSPKGELLIKGPSVFSGYWNDEEKTK